MTTLTLVRDRISKQECPICGKTFVDDQFDYIVDEYITKDDVIKICKTHKVNINSKQL